MTTRTLRPSYDTPLRIRQKFLTVLPTRYRLARYRNHLKAWRSLAYFLRIWKARSVFRSTLAFCQEFNDISARFSRRMSTDFMWDPNMDTEVLLLRVHIGRTYFRPRFFISLRISFLRLYIRRSVYAFGHTELYPASFKRCSLVICFVDHSSTHDAYLLVRNDCSTHRF